MIDDTILNCDTFVCVRGGGGGRGGGCQKWILGMTIYVDIFCLGHPGGHHYVGLFVGSSLSSVTRGLFLFEHFRLFFFFFFFLGGGGVISIC